MKVLIGTNESVWAWEYDYRCRKAELYLDIETNILYLNMSEQYVKSGLGKGEFNYPLEDNYIEVGTLSKPLKLVIIKYLNKHKFTSTPFKRGGWYSNETKSLSLSQVLENAINSKSKICRELKLKKLLYV